MAIDCVIRRVGGLEAKRRANGKNRDVIRRVGGLEVAPERVVLAIVVIRRVGGLEDSVPKHQLQ